MTDQAEYEYRFNDIIGDVRVFMMLSGAVGMERGGLVYIMPPDEWFARADAQAAEHMSVQPESTVLHVATDRYGRTWRVLDREDTFAVYYTRGADPTRHIIYDSQDAASAPPRVLLGRATEAERRVLTLEQALREAIVEYEGVALDAYENTSAEPGIRERVARWRAALEASGE